MLATTPVFGPTDPTDLGGSVLVHTRYRLTPLGQKGSNAAIILQPTKPGACPRVPMLGMAAIECMQIGSRPAGTARSPPLPCRGG